MLLSLGRVYLAFKIVFPGINYKYVHYHTFIPAKVPQIIQFRSTNIIFTRYSNIFLDNNPQIQTKSAILFLYNVCNNSCLSFDYLPLNRSQKQQFPLTYNSRHKYWEFCILLHFHVTFQPIRLKSFATPFKSML